MDTATPAVGLDTEIWNGPLPEWISAGTGAAALVLAVAAARAAYRQLMILTRQEHDRQVRDMQASAASVAVWIRVSNHDGHKPEPVLRYTNTSGLPVYDLQIFVETAEHTFVVNRTVAGPHDARDMGQGTRQIRIQAGEIRYEPDWSALLDSNSLTCAMRFRDPSNRWWIREVDGRLSPAESDSVPKTLRYPGRPAVVGPIPA